MTSHHEIRTPQCPICQSSSTHVLTKDDYPYYRCSNCEFLFYRSQEKDREKSTPSPYDEHYWEMERAEAIRREKEDCLVRALELLYLSSIKVETILDFGCGPGLTVNLLRDKLGLNAVGVDISADFAESEHLHKCDLADLAAKYPPGYFDAIYSVEVFEHLVDPRQILAQLQGLLKPGGKILINTSTQEFIVKYDPEMSYIDPVRRMHISIYSLKSFSELASALGYAASFLGDRKYVVMLSPSNSGALFPTPENLDRVRRLGDWFPALLTEYMRLIFVEEEFDKKCRLVESLSPKRPLPRLLRLMQRCFQK